MTRARWRMRTTSSRARSGVRHLRGEVPADRRRTGGGFPSSRRGREGGAPDPERAPAAPRLRGTTATCSRSSPVRPRPIRSCRRPPHRRVASRPRRRGRRPRAPCSATRPASTRVPVAYWTTLKATTTVVGSTASTRSCVRSRSARSSMNRSEIPRRSAAASHGYVTLGKSDPTRRMVPCSGSSSEVTWPSPSLALADDGDRIGRGSEQLGAGRTDAVQDRSLLVVAEIEVPELRRLLQEGIHRIDRRNGYQPQGRLVEVGAALEGRVRSRGTSEWIEDICASKREPAPSDDGSSPRRLPASSSAASAISLRTNVTLRWWALRSQVASIRWAVGASLRARPWQPHCASPTRRSRSR